MHDAQGSDLDRAGAYASFAGGRSGRRSDLDVGAKRGRHTAAATNGIPARWAIYARFHNPHDHPVRMGVGHELKENCHGYT